MEHWHHNRRIGIALSKQLGNTNTDTSIAQRMVSWTIDWDTVTPTTRFLEPAVGGGAFVFAIIDALVARGFSLPDVCANQIVAADIDPNAIARFQQEATQRYGADNASKIQVACRDFLTSEEPYTTYDWIITNPPYVSERNLTPPDGWEKAAWLETAKARLRYPMPPRADLYALFHARALDLLAPGGRALFLCSDSWIDAGFGSDLIHRITTGPWALETLINSQLLPFFRDDTNAILTVIKHHGTDTPKPDVAILNLRTTTWEAAETATPIWWTQEDLATLLHSNQPNRRNALVLFNAEYTQVESLWTQTPDAWVSVHDAATVKTSPLGASFFAKDRLGRANRGALPVFWQLQGRSNRPADYRTFIPHQDLTLWVDPSEAILNGKPGPVLDNAVFLSTIIDRFPLVFYTDTPALHVNKYLALVSHDTTESKAHFAARLESIPAVLSLEQRMKEGTRKTLRTGEKGLAKEIAKSDLQHALLPKPCDLTPVDAAITAYQGTVIANLEEALHNPAYWATQVHMANALGYRASLLDLTRMAVFLYVLRMRHLEKLAAFESWYTKTFATRLSVWMETKP